VLYLVANGYLTLLAYLAEQYVKDATQKATSIPKLFHGNEPIAFHPNLVQMKKLKNAGFHITVKNYL